MKKAFLLNAVYQLPIVAVISLSMVAMGLAGGYIAVIGGGRKQAEKQSGKTHMLTW